MNNELKNQYVNDVDSDFNKCITLDNWNLINYGLILIISIISLFYDNNIFNILTIVLNIIYLSIYSINDIFYKNFAETERRKTLISNAFDKNLTIKETKNFYNNTASPSIVKMGINFFESSFFTKNILYNMLMYKTIKAIVSIIVYIVLLILAKEISLILLITQTLFSTEILYDLIKTINYYYVSKKVYDRFYSIFITNKLVSKDIITEIIDISFEYECIKSYSHILLSKREFNKNNNSLSIKWQNILANIKVNKR